MTPNFTGHDVTLLAGGALAVLAELPERPVGCVVTSPPYSGARDYGAGGQLGREPTAGEYVARLAGYLGAGCDGLCTVRPTRRAAQLLGSRPGAGTGGPG